MSVTIAATASGSLTAIPRTGESVINGDFTINYNRFKDLSDPANLIDRNSFETGDGRDEETNWTFYFNEDPNFSLFSPSPLQPLTSALLTLTLKPARDAIGGLNTDKFWIETLPVIDLVDALKNVFPSLTFDRVPDIDTDPNQITNRNIDSVLLLDQATTITFNLLDHYKPEGILNTLFSSLQGRITMRYNDDAIISFAQLDLTQESL